MTGSDIGRASKRISTGDKRHFYKDVGVDAKRFCISFELLLFLIYKNDPLNVGRKKTLSSHSPLSGRLIQSDAYGR